MTAARPLRLVPSPGSGAADDGSAPAAPTAIELDTLFTGRLRRTGAAVLADKHARVVFDAGPSGAWTVAVDAGRLRLHRGRPTGGVATTTIRTDPATLAAVVSGRQSGARAFLDGRLLIRGDLALAHQLDAAFEVADRPVDHPRADVVAPLGVRTTYLEAGPADAPPVVLLHGLGATNASLMPLLLDLARDHRVLAPDLPGHGDTAAPRWPYAFRDFARWLAAFQRATATTGASLVGNSLGGRIALEAAMRHPDNVPGLVLLCPSPAFRRLRQLVPVARLVPPGLARAPLPPLPHRLVVEGIRAMFARPDRLPRSWYDAGADEHRRVMRDGAHRRAFYACLRQIYVEEAHGRHGFWSRLPRVSAPTLFVWGDRDRLVPSGFARHVTAALPGARSVVLADSGHVPQFEHPHRTAELTRELLGRAVRRAG